MAGVAYLPRCHSRAARSTGMQATYMYMYLPALSGTTVLLAQPSSSSSGNSEAREDLPYTRGGVFCCNANQPSIQATPLTAQPRDSRGPHLSLLTPTGHDVAVSGRRGKSEVQPRLSGRRASKLKSNELRAKEWMS